MAVYTDGGQFDVSAVSFGVESANVNQTVIVRLYTAANFPEGFPDSLTQIGTASVSVGSAQNGTVVTASLGATVPAGTSQLVMELNTPDGRSTGHLFFVGSNSAPETGPSYVTAGACGSNSPTTTTAAGAPNMHIVFNVVGTCHQPTSRPATLLNISTRLTVGTGDRAMTAGFIVLGNAPKRVLIRGVGPSLAGLGVPNALTNPQLELHDASTIIGRNDDWQTTQVGGVITSDQVAEIQNSGLAPSKVSESALIGTVAPGSYTAIMQGVAGGTGVGIVEVYDLDVGNTSLLANISTRGYVQTGDNVMIGGFIITNQPTRVLIRAIGPSLSNGGVPDVLGNPQLELHDGSSILGRNDDWQTTQLGGIITQDQVAEIQSTHVAPTEITESAIIATLPLGSYTAIVRGVNNTSGNAVVEVYALP
jgi:hypothetical protein